MHHSFFGLVCQDQLIGKKNLVGSAPQFSPSMPPQNRRKTTTYSLGTRIVTMHNKFVSLQDNIFDELPEIRRRPKLTDVQLELIRNDKLAPSGELAREDCGPPLNFSSINPSDPHCPPEETENPRCKKLFEMVSH